MINQQIYKERSWIEIDLDALIHNVHEISTLLKKPSQIMAVVKADAYGHGAPIIAQTLEKSGIRYFAVATLDEAIELRMHHIQSEILILGYTSPHLAKLIV